MTDKQFIVNKNNVHYVDGEWTGTMWGRSSLMILKGTDVIFVTHHRNINTLEKLKECVETWQYIDYHTQLRKKEKEKNENIS